MRCVPWRVGGRGAGGRQQATDTMGVRCSGKGQDMDAGISRPVIGTINTSTIALSILASAAVCWVFGWNWPMFFLGLFGVGSMYPLYNWYSTMDGPIMSVLMMLSGVFFMNTMYNVASTFGMLD